MLANLPQEVFLVSLFVLQIVDCVSSETVKITEKHKNGVLFEKAIQFSAVLRTSQVSYGLNLSLYFISHISVYFLPYLASNFVFPTEMLPALIF